MVLEESVALEGLEKVVLQESVTNMVREGNRVCTTSFCDPEMDDILFLLRGN